MRSSTSATRRTRRPTGGLRSRSARLPTTARSIRSAANREQVRGRAADRAERPDSRPARLLAAGPLIPRTAPTRSRSTRRSSCSSRPGGGSTRRLLALVPEAPGMRVSGHPGVAAFARPLAGLIAPWDGPAAICFGDGRRVGALVDRNGLRPMAFAVTADRLVAAASEAVLSRSSPERWSGAVAWDPASCSWSTGSWGDPRGCRGEDGRPPSLLATGRSATGAPRPDRTRGGCRPGRRPDPDGAALPCRARRRAGPPRHPDDDPGGPRAALEHGR